ncbi:prophage tail fiber N-terminal domain-containing protein [Sodalis sp. RH22]|uniref:prophage tail fiber N-terminal domain-containing protein n=1 Tax=unclassified Sodalis (in: enterobacteria) TaxID=2636512 RepID=UPI0039B4DC6B
MTVISGVLTAPDGSVLPNVSIILKAISTSSQVVVQTESTTVTGSNGAYSISAKVGEYQVSISAYGQPTVSVGNIQIFPDSANGTLNDFLTTPGEDALTPVIVATVESMRIAAQSAATDAIAARDLAQQAAAHAEAVTDGGATYASDAAGLVATTSGQYFRVPQGVGAQASFKYFLNNDGVAVEVAEAVGKAAVDAVAASVSAIKTKTDALPADFIGFQIDANSVALGAYDPITKRLAGILRNNGRLIELNNSDGLYYEVLTTPENQLIALGTPTKAPAFVQGEQVWRAVVDNTTKQMVEAYTIKGGHFINSDRGLVRANDQYFGTGGSTPVADTLPIYGTQGSAFIYPYSDTVPIAFIFIHFGQSIRRGFVPTGANDTLIASVATYPNNAFMLSGGVRRDGARTTTLVPLVETSVATTGGADMETPASGCANHFIRDMAAATGITPRTISIVCAKDGQTYDTLKRGTANYQNMLNAVTDATAACKAKGWLPICLLVDHEQGETDETNNALRAGTREASLKQFEKQASSDIVAITGQKEKPIFCLSQIAYVNDTVDIFRQEYIRMAVNNLHGVGNFRVVNTLYQYPTNAVDGLHMTCAAMNQSGANIARYIIQEWFNQGNAGMLPSSVRWNSPTQIEFPIPSATDLMLNTAIINQTTLVNHGFNYTDESGTPPAIASVGVSSKSIYVNLASAPTGKYGRIAYACSKSPLQAGATFRPNGNQLGARGSISDSGNYVWLYDSSVNLYNFVPAFQMNTY